MHKQNAQVRAALPSFTLPERKIAFVGRPHIPAVKAERKAPQVSPQTPLRTARSTYLLEGCIRPPENASAKLTLLEGGHIKLETESDLSLNFPLSALRRWHRMRGRGSDDCMAEFKLENTSIYLNIGDVGKFIQICS